VQELCIDKRQRRTASASCQDDNIRQNVLKTPELIEPNIQADTLIEAKFDGTTYFASSCCVVTLFLISTSAIVKCCSGLKGTGRAISCDIDCELLFAS